MAIDGGTGSIRAVIFDLNGHQVSVEQREWRHLEDPNFPGSMDFDVVINYKLMLECIAGAIHKSGINGHDIHALSTSSMREGIVLYDDHKHEIWACANVDARANLEVKQLKDISFGIEEKIYGLSGQTFALGALPRLLWVKNNLPDVYEKTRTITMLNDWIVFKLTGELMVEPSNASTSGMLNIRNRNWDLDIIQLCGMKDDIYPPVYESGTIIGKVTPDIAELTGLSSKCLVVAGGGDAQLGSIGVGAVEAGQAALFGGSFWQLEYNIDSPILDTSCRTRLNSHAIPNLWQYELITFFPGLVMRWYKNAFCHVEKMIEKKTGVDSYYLMDQQAAKVPPGSYGMQCTFSDTMNYISWKHAAPAFINFSIDDKFDHTVFYRAILENAALVSLGHKRMVESLTHKPIQTITFASGASKSKLWSSIVADVLGIPVSVPFTKEASALGAAMLAGVGAGIFNNVTEASKAMTKIEAVFEPNLENNKHYQEQFDKWQHIYSSNLHLADHGLTTHMWKAPGL